MKKIILGVMLAGFISGSTLLVTEQPAFAKRNHKVNKASKKKHHVTKRTTTTKRTTSQTKTTTTAAPNVAPTTAPAATSTLPK